MKKSLLALAVLGAFAGAASAQSSVTIYGLLDQGIAKSNNGDSVNPGSGESSALKDSTVSLTDKTGRWALQQAAASRLGFRGVEDLGGGLSAFFDFQHRFNPDTGGQTATAFWHAKSVVGLKGGFGTLTLGRDYALAFWPAVNADPWGWDTVGQAGARYTWAGYGIRGTTGVRYANQIAYTSPSFGGFTISGAVSPGEGATDYGKSFGLNAEYKGGPIYAAFGYDRSDALATGSSDPNLLVGSFAYDFGVVRPVVLLARGKHFNGGDLTGDGVADAVEKSTSILLGLTAPIGNGVLKAAIARVKFDIAGDVDPKGTKFSVGYFYNLSKRTAVYADLGSAKDKDPDLSRTTSFDLGVKHSF